MKAKCKICRTSFNKMNLSHKVCSTECAIAIAVKDRELKEKKEQRKKWSTERSVLKEKKLALRSRSEWLKLAQAEFNKFIRKRDDKLPCVSCGRHHQGQSHAGHYLSTGARPELRFDEANCHKQCAPCNNHLSGNIVLYRKALVHKIGQDEVDRLEGAHLPKKWTIDDLKGIIAIYRKKTKELIQ